MRVFGFWIMRFLMASGSLFWTPTSLVSYTKYSPSFNPLVREQEDRKDRKMRKCIYLALITMSSYP